MDVLAELKSIKDRGVIEACIKEVDELRTQLSQPNTEQDIANKIAKRLPIWMLDTYDKDSLSSMLSAVSYLKQQVSNQSDHNT